MSIPWDQQDVYQVQVLASKPDDLSCIPEIHIVKGKNNSCSITWHVHALSPSVSLSHSYTHTHSIYMHTQYINKCNTNLSKCVYLYKLAIANLSYALTCNTGKLDSTASVFLWLSSVT